MSVRELRRLKKLLLEANTPSREEEICKALKIVFGDIEATPGEEEKAFTVLDWDYKSRAELFGDVPIQQIRENISINEYDNCSPIVINRNLDIPSIPGAIKHIKVVPVSNKAD